MRGKRSEFRVVGRGFRGIGISRAIMVARFAALDGPASPGPAVASGIWGMLLLSALLSLALPARVSATDKASPPASSARQTAMAMPPGGGTSSISSVTATPASIAADGTSTSSLLATVMNNGAPAPNQSVSFSTTAGTFRPGMSTTTTGTTDGQGNATVTLCSSTTSGTATVTASISGSSRQASVTFTGGGVGAPTAVTLNNPINVQQNQMALIWTQNRDASFQSYKLYRSNTAGVTQASTLVTTQNQQSTTTFTDTGLNANTTCYYKLYVTNMGGVSAGSNEVSATTQAPPPPARQVSSVSLTANPSNFPRMASPNQFSRQRFTAPTPNRWRICW